jgi:formamidopyrimidine-DNA glycosylase
MPELPEVETVRRSLLNRVVGRKIVGLEVGDFAGVLAGQSPVDVAIRLSSRSIAGVRRRAKYLLLDLDDETALVIHLRMTGRLSVVPHEEPPLRHQRLAFALSDGCDLRFSDQRKFGRVVHLLPQDLDALDQRLGREPLAPVFTAEWLSDRLSRRTGKIKAVILDQQLIAGLGNIYADESLFLAGINPVRPANTLTSAEVERLVRAIRDVLQNAVNGRGTTISSFEDSDGNRGGYGANLSVYGRGGKGACLRCGTPLTRVVVGGRGTSFCSTCQPLAPAASDEERQ